VFGADEVPAEDEHKGDDMRKEAGVFDDFLGVREDGLFGFDKEEPGEREEDIFVVRVEESGFEFEFGEDFLEFVGESDEEGDLFDEGADFGESVSVFDRYFFGEFPELGSRYLSMQMAYSDLWVLMRLLRERPMPLIFYP
jgi:hypothetical protein